MKNSIVKKTVKKIAIKQSGLKEKKVVKKIKAVISHVTAEIQKLIKLGFRLSRPNTEPHLVYQLVKKGYFKAGKDYVVAKMPLFIDRKEKNLCLNGQLLLSHLTGLKIVNKVYDETRNETKSKKKVLSFSLSK